MQSKRIAPNLIGQKFNRLLVTTQDLTNGHTKSCGCFLKESTGKRSSTHGMSHENIFFVWNSMLQRCFNPHNKSFSRYGGRGIIVCDEWKNDFQSFYDYVSKLPHFCEAGYSLDRINNDGNYEPDNVRWATSIEQANNRKGKVKRND